MQHTQHSKLSKTALASLAFAALSACATQPAAPETQDGMIRLSNAALADMYVLPGVNLAAYRKIYLDKASVSFRTGWQKDKNRLDPFRIRDKDVQDLKQGVSDLFQKVFTQELTKAGFHLTDQRGPDVLELHPAIVDLDIVAPDVQHASRVLTFSDSAGSMTLKLDLLDATSGRRLATATDRKRDFPEGYREWRTRVSNRVDAVRMMSSWAVALAHSIRDASAANEG